MAAEPSPDEYTNVVERIESFYATYPEGSLTRAEAPYVIEIAGKAYVVYTAKAHRTPDDPVPAMGVAWEPVPGRTPYTRGSELMHAETVAWGRAIIAAGIGAKRGSAIASREEIAARTPAEDAAPTAKEGMSIKQAAKVLERLSERGLSDDDIDRQLAAFGVEGIVQLTPAQANELLASVDA